jgi:hypothetical protein
MRLDDVLIGIGYHLPEGRKSFVDKENQVQRFFYQEKPNYPQLLRDIIFDTNGTFPYSKQLQQELSQLVETQILVFISPNPNHLHFGSDIIDASYETHIKKRISQKEEIELIELSKKFDKQVATEQRFVLSSS